MIGLCFLFRNRLIQLIGHWALLFFIVVTYSIAPVYGFGLLLIVAGMLLARESFENMMPWYLGTAIYLVVLDFLWLLFEFEFIDSIIFVSEVTL